nr:endo-1,4-beta-D-mannanase {N-terminal} {EC 3.2.1.78} [Littorina brevicula=marine molluscs, viscera, Peptide Partial, 30 aa] [Littorina brevicula]
GYLTRSGKHFVHNGKKVFLSGANTAWVAYG